MADVDPYVPREIRQIDVLVACETLLLAGHTVEGLTVLTKLLEHDPKVQEALRRLRHG